MHINTKHFGLTIVYVKQSEIMNCLNYGVPLSLNVVIISVNCAVWKGLAA